MLLCNGVSGETYWKLPPRNTSGDLSSFPDVYTENQTNHVPGPHSFPGTRHCLPTAFIVQYIKYIIFDDVHLYK